MNGISSLAKKDTLLGQSTDNCRFSRGQALGVAREH
jgi:hypothetical protein